MIIFTKLFLSNIINHGESDVQWQISIYGSHLRVLGISLRKKKEALSMQLQSPNGTTSTKLDTFQKHI